MKKILFLLVVASCMCFISCKGKISTEDKMFIDFQIALHNSTFGLQYKSDSIDRRSTLKTAYMHLGNSDASSDKYVDSINNEIYKKDKDHKYNPQSDPHLTFEKFMDYCEKNKYKTAREHAESLAPVNK